MKSIRVEKQGGPEVLKLLDIAPIEAPGPGQAVVRVVAAGVNFVDVGQRRATYPRQVPFTLGVEGAGVVESVGEGVRNVKPSDRVAFTGPSTGRIYIRGRRGVPVAGHGGTLSDLRIPAACFRQFRADSRGCGRDGRAPGALGQAPRGERDRDSLD
jgi:NADPH:quinone reductase-like Zn-dependent oxidoreductase